MFLEDIQVQLNTLQRIIAKFGGHFSLTVVHCNDLDLRNEAVDFLEKELKSRYSVLAIAPDTRSLHQAVLSHIGNCPPKALMVVGLENVIDIDSLLARANLTRDLFLKDFPFPLILWIADPVAKKLGRIAPDFNSWASTISFLSEDSTSL